MKKHTEKADYGYLQKNKILQLAISLVLMLIILAMFYTGYIKYHNTKNIFTVFSVVSVIPAAKFMVAYIVMAPYKSISKELYQRISKHEKVALLYDLLISSPERIIHIGIAAVRDNSVFMYVPDKKYKKTEVEKYVRSFLEKECKVAGVKMYTKFEDYENAITAMEKNEAGKYDKRIGDLMRVFSM